jgi:flagellar motor switch protein FliN
MTNPTGNNEVYAVAAAPPATSARSETQMAALLSLPVSVAVSVGRVRASIEQLLSAGPDTILTLDTKIDDPVELIVDDHVIARGRLVDLEDGAAVGVEITEVIEMTKRSSA